MNFELEFGKSTLQNKGAVKSGNVINNAKFHPGKSAIQVPAVPAKGHSAQFILSSDLVAGLNLELNAVTDQYVAFQGNSETKELYILNVTGIITDEATLKTNKFARVTKQGTFSSKYLMEMVQKALELDNNVTYDLVVKVVDGGNMTGAAQFTKETLKELSNDSEGSNDVVEAETKSAEDAQPTVNDTQDAVSEAAADTASEENDSADTEDEAYW